MLETFGVCVVVVVVRAGADSAHDLILCDEVVRIWYNVGCHCLQ